MTRVPASGQPAAEGDVLLQRRFRLAKPWLPDPARTMLDFGCGNGSQTLLFAPHVDRVHGLDISPDFLDDLRRRAAALGLADRLEARTYDGRDIPHPDGAFDVLTSFEVLEHVPDEAYTLSEWRRVLAPGGRLIISVPNRWWIFETHGADLPLLPWNRVPFFSWLPKSIHDRWARARIYTRGEIVGKLEAAGFEVEHTAYVTAPMDVIPWRGLREALRGTVFRGDETPMPILSTAVIAVARR